MTMTKKTTRHPKISKPSKSKALQVTSGKRIVLAGSSSEKFYHFMRGKGTIVGDIVKPAISGDEWESS